MPLPVKDIRKFREFFKTNICENTLPNRDPHYAGHSRSTPEGNVFGFFDLYHGRKPDMENLLKTILEMARDSQALYEFMQNAVDAESTDFMLFHHWHEATGQDYLVVANNGDAFNLRGVLAILNIAASNKYRDSTSIGQFGVGFKLAHRLVGEEEGLKALMEENKGPILFSWEKGELETLATSQELILVQPQLEGLGDNAVCNDLNPWLFKILYTNFPCLPNDMIVDAKGQEITNAFTSYEAAALRDAAQKCLEAASGKDYTHGTVLLIPLHPAKITELTQDAARYGLEISTTILNDRSGKHKELSRIMLNGEELSTLETSAERFRYDDPPNLFDGINTLEIDFLYGDPLSGHNPFGGKPQFYLYFPMTEERHGFRFAIHCNGFSFTAARTALQDKSPKNKAIFGMLTDGLRKRLGEYAISDKLRFERLYTSLVLSKPGDLDKWKENREWLEDDFWNGLLELVRDFVPVMDGMGSWRIATLGDKVLIKTTALPLEEWYQGAAQWFFWDLSTQMELCHAAQSKTGATSVSLIDVLEQASAIESINTWLNTVENGSVELLQELNRTHHQFASRKDKAKGIWDNIAKLRLWTFDGIRYSIDELSEESNKHLLLSYGPITSLESLLQRVGFKHSIEKLDSFEMLEDDLRQRNEARLPYLRNYKELNILLSTRFVTTDCYNPAEKQEIFLVITKAIRDSANNAAAVLPERMKVLALFANIHGEVKPLEELVQLPNLPSALDGWHIRRGDIGGLDLTAYTASTPETVYLQVIYKNWKAVASYLATVSPAARVDAFRAIADWHSSKPGMETLPSEEIVFTEGFLLASNAAYFCHPYLEDFAIEEYDALASASEKIKLGALPQKSLLPFYNRIKPFVLQHATSAAFKLEEEVSLPPKEAVALVKVCLKVDESAIKSTLFTEKADGNIRLEAMAGTALHQCASIEANVRAFIQKICADYLVLLPACLNAYSNYVTLKDEKLYERVVYEFRYTDAESLQEILTLVKGYGTPDLKLALLKKLADDEPLLLTSDLTAESPLTILLKFALDASNQAEAMKFFSAIACVQLNGAAMRLASITDKGSDRLIVQGNTRQYEFSISALLGKTSANATNELLTKAATEWAKLGIGSADDIQEALGVHEQRDPLEVLGDLKDLISEEGLLENAQQFAFALAMGERDATILQGLCINTLGDPARLREDFYFYEAGESLVGILPGDLLLSKEYSGTLALLQTSDNVVYRSGDVQVLHQPFILDADLIAPGLECNQTGNSSPFLRHLYSLWQSADLPKMLRYDGGLEKWKDILGFDPRCLILDPTWQTESERDELTYYQGVLLVEPASALPFFRALGSQGPGGVVSAWRKYLSGKGEAPDDILYTSNALGTLRWLAATALPVTDEKLAPLYNTVKHLELGEIPLPMYHPYGIDLKVFNAEEKMILILLDADYQRASSQSIRPSEFASCTGYYVIPQMISTAVLWPKINATYGVADINWDVVDYEAIDTVSQEWSLPWYKTWAAAYNARISFIPGEVPRMVSIGGDVIKKYPKGEAVTSQSDAHIIYVRDFGTSAAIAAIDALNELPESTMTALREAYDADRKNTDQLLDTIRDQSVLKELYKQIEEAAKVQDRQDAADRLQDASTKYTMQWFADLLELVKKQESIAGAPTVEFERVLASSKFKGVYELSHGNGEIPSNIEEYEKVTARINYRDSNGKPTHREVAIEPSKKHRTLSVTFPDPAIRQILDTGSVLSVQITFARTTDLLQALKRGFTSLNYAPDFNLKTTLSPNIRFIYGPPGTGKTTEVAKRLIKRMESGEKSPVIVLTPTNKAADVLAQKIIDIFSEEKKPAPSWLKRFGTCNDAKLLDAGIIDADVTVNPSTAIVLITTIHRFPYAKVRIRSSDAETYSLCDAPWALVIFDEASMIPLPYAAFTIHKRAKANPDTQFLVAGDPLQIPPVFDLSPDDIDKPDNAEELQKENIYTMVGLHSFDEHEQNLIPIYGERKQIDNLPAQHRSIPVIGELFSRFQYGGKLRHSRGTENNPRTDQPRPLPQLFQKMGFKPITVIRYKVSGGDTIYNPKRVNRSPLHIYSALLVNELMKHFDKAVTNEKMEKWSVGVISPYKAQANLMGRMIESSLAFNELVTVAVDTVHGFQGDQNQLMIAVLNPGNVNAVYSRFLKEAHILNVAISRSEDYLILFIPDEETDGIRSLPLIHSQYAGSILNIIQALPKNLVAEISASSLEETMMKEQLYFERHTRTTAHQTVNVYGAPQTPYLFRIAGNAVDVHWQV